MNKIFFVKQISILNKQKYLFVLNAQQLNFQKSKRKIKKRTTNSSVNILTKFKIFTFGNLN